MHTQWNRAFCVSNSILSILEFLLLFMFMDLCIVAHTTRRVRKRTRRICGERARGRGTKTAAAAAAGINNIHKNFVVFFRFTLFSVLCHKHSELIFTTFLSARKLIVIIEWKLIFPTDACRFLVPTSKIKINAENILSIFLDQRISLLVATEKLLKIYMNFGCRQEIFQFAENSNNFI